MHAVKSVKCAKTTHPRFTRKSLSQRNLMRRMETEKCKLYILCLWGLSNLYDWYLFSVIQFHNYFQFNDRYIFKAIATIFVFLNNIITSHSYRKKCKIGDWAWSSTGRHWMQIKKLKNQKFWEFVLNLAHTIHTRFSGNQLFFFCCCCCCYCYLVHS